MADRPFDSSAAPGGEPRAAPGGIDGAAWALMRDRRMTADEVLQYFDVNHPPVRVTALARAMGIAVREADAEDWSGCLEVKEGKPTIHVATGESEFRQRFSIAHEIAHLLLHPLNGGVVYRDKSFDGSAQETEANTFAADLLMPIWMLDPYVMQFGADIPKLANLFQVSAAAMKVRLQTWLGR